MGELGWGEAGMWHPLKSRRRITFIYSLKTLQAWGIVCVPSVLMNTITQRSHARFWCFELCKIKKQHKQKQHPHPTSPQITACSASSGTRCLMFCDVKSRHERCKISTEVLSSLPPSCLESFLHSAADLIFQECKHSVFITHSYSRKWGRGEKAAVVFMYPSPCRGCRRPSPCDWQHPRWRLSSSGHKRE